MKAQYRIYGFDSCPFCQKAKALLQSEGLPFEYIDLESDLEKKLFLDARGFQPPHRTFPRVYAIADCGEEVLIGGYTDLENHILFEVA